MLLKKNKIKQRIGLFLILLSPTFAFAQPSYKILQTDSVKNVLINLYNEDNADAVYDLCDSGFQKFMSRKDFIQWLSQTRQSLGMFIQTKEKGKLNGFIVYQSYFQNDSMDLFLAVNRLGKITSLAIRPIPPLEKAYLAQSDNTLKNKIDSLVERVIRPYIQQENTVGVSIGIIYKGKFYRYGYGETEKGNHRIPNDNTIFEIGSITKTFTASLLAELALQGKCRLSDPVNKYLPDSISLLQKNDTPVTLEMLANHTSGLPRIPLDLYSVAGSLMNDPYKNYNDEDLFSYLDSVRLQSTPGTHFDYSNLGFGLLGTVSEKISGLSYEKLLEKYICDPLGLRDTRTVLNEAQQKRFAKGYDRSGKAVNHWHFKCLAGCGAIRSSVNDLLKYLNAHLNDKPSTELNKGFRLCEQPTFNIVNGRIGLAWLIQDRLHGEYWHNGGTGGFSSYCAYNREKQVAVIILSNSSASEDKEGFELIRELSE